MFTNDLVLRFDYDIEVKLTYEGEEDIYSIVKFIESKIHKVPDFWNFIVQASQSRKVFNYDKYISDQGIITESRSEEYFKVFYHDISYSIALSEFRVY